jgi:hypothetical protein
MVVRRSSFVKRRSTSPPTLLIAPVEVVDPVVDELAQVGAVGSVRPRLRVRIVGPARAGQALAEIGERRVGGVAGESVDHVAGCWLLVRGDAWAIAAFYNQSPRTSNQ